MRSSARWTAGATALPERRDPLERPQAVPAVACHGRHGAGTLMNLMCCAGSPSLR
jgi:hypothetical protein